MQRTKEIELRVKIQVPEWVESIDQPNIQGPEFFDFSPSDDYPNGMKIMLVKLAYICREHARGDAMKSGCQTILISRCSFQGFGHGQCDFFRGYKPGENALCIHYFSMDNECTSREAKRAEKPEEAE